MSCSMLQKAGSKAIVVRLLPMTKHFVSRNPSLVIADPLLVQLASSPRTNEENWVWIGLSVWSSMVAIDDDVSGIGDFVGCCDTAGFLLAWQFLPNRAILLRRLIITRNKLING